MYPYHPSLPYFSVELQRPYRSLSPGGRCKPKCFEQPVEKVGDNLPAFREIQSKVYPKYRGHMDSIRRHIDQNKRLIEHLSGNIRDNDLRAHGGVINTLRNYQFEMRAHMERPVQFQKAKCHCP